MASGRANEVSARVWKFRRGESDPQNFNFEWSYFQLKKTATAYNKALHPIGSLKEMNLEDVVDLIERQTISEWRPYQIKLSLGPIVSCDSADSYQLFFTSLFLMLSLSVDHHILCPDWVLPFSISLFSWLSTPSFGLCAELCQFFYNYHCHCVELRSSVPLYIALRLHHFLHNDLEVSRFAVESPTTTFFLF